MTKNNIIYEKDYLPNWVIWLTEKDMLQILRYLAKFASKCIYTFLAWQRLIGCMHFCKITFIDETPYDCIFIKPVSFKLGITGIEYIYRHQYLTRNCNPLDKI